MFGGNVGVDACRVLGREISAARSRILAVAVRAARGAVRCVEPGGVRMGVRKEAWGVGRPREVRDWVSW